MAISEGQQIYQKSMEIILYNTDEDPKLYIEQNMIRIILISNKQNWADVLLRFLLTEKQKN